MIKKFNLIILTYNFRLIYIEYKRKIIKYLLKRKAPKFLKETILKVYLLKMNTIFGYDMGLSVSRGYFCWSFETKMYDIKSYSLALFCKFLFPEMEPFWNTKSINA